MFTKIVMIILMIVITVTIFKVIINILIQVLSGNEHHVRPPSFVAAAAMLVFGTLDTESDVPLCVVVTFDSQGVFQWPSKSPQRHMVTPGMG